MESSKSLKPFLVPEQFLFSGTDDFRYFNQFLNDLNRFFYTRYFLIK